MRTAQRKVTVELNAAYGTSTRKFELSIPGNSRLKFDPSQSTLIVIDAGGDHLAVIKGVQKYHSNSITIKDVTPASKVNDAPRRSRTIR